MPTVSDQAVRQFWDQRARDGAAENAVTHRDVWQRWLELQVIERYLQPDLRVLDVGCGNGYTTLQIAPRVREVVGIDRSADMIERARRAQAALSRPTPGVSFAAIDVLALTPEHFGQFDLALSERCLINLTSWTDHCEALARIAGVVRPSGHFLLLEGSRVGRQRLDLLRAAVGLPAQPVVWHNLDFDRDELLAYLARHFAVEQETHFGVYDFLARVVHPLLVAPAEPQYEARINELAARLALHRQDLGDLSRMLVLYLRRKQT